MISQKSLRLWGLGARNYIWTMESKDLRCCMTKYTAWWTHYVKIIKINVLKKYLVWHLPNFLYSCITGEKGKLRKSITILSLLLLILFYSFWRISLIFSRLYFHLNLSNPAKSWFDIRFIISDNSLKLTISTCFYYYNNYFFQEYCHC